MGAYRSAVLFLSDQQEIMTFETLSHLDARIRAQHGGG